MDQKESKPSHGTPADAIPTYLPAMWLANGMSARHHQEKTVDCRGHHGVVFMICLLVALLAMPTPGQQIDSARVKSLKSQASLSPADAYVLVEVELSPLVPGQAFSNATRRYVSQVMCKVLWPPDLDEKGLGRFVDDAEQRFAPSLLTDVAAAAALGLVLAAWDAHSDRVQVANFDTVLACPDNRIVFLKRGETPKGRLYTTSYVSYEWPWTRDGRDRLTLQPTGIGIAYGNLSESYSHAIIDTWKFSHKLWERATAPRAAP